MRVRLTVIHIALALTCLLINGCVDHSPSSEAIIFTKTQPNFSSTHVSAGGSITYAPAWELANDLAEADYPDERRVASVSDLAYNGRRMSGALFRSYLDPDHRVGYSATLGVLAAGIDVTAKVYDPVFVTGVVSAGGQRGLLQLKMVERPSFGVAFGLGYGRETFTYDGLELFEFTRLSLNTYVARTVLLYRDFGEEGAAVKFTFHVGYSNRFDRTTFGFSLSTGRF